MSNVFQRNIRARDHLELFLVSAASSLLLLRFYLQATGFPTVGGHNYHIAHMLYGGILMMIAIALVVSFIGARVLRLASLVGGVGFGIFIDELGKFITRNNNYFFRPAIGIIYAVFIIMYLFFNFLGRRQNLTSQEYQLNALNQFEEAVLHDMDPQEKTAMRDMLKHADASSPITKALLKLLEQVDTVPPHKAGYVRKVLGRVSAQYHRFWRHRGSKRLVAAAFVIETALFVLSVFGTLYHNFHDLTSLFHAGDSYGHTLIIGELASSVVAAGFAIAGALQLPKSRTSAFELFRRAILINLLLTEFFIFSRIQLGAVPGFVLNLILFVALRFAMYQERSATK